MNPANIPISFVFFVTFSARIKKNNSSSELFSYDLHNIPFFFLMDMYTIEKGMQRKNRPS
jgi:hypothetical protein